MKRALFTICTKNYIGLSMALKKAVENYSSEVDFFVFIADECDEFELGQLPDCAVIAKQVLPIATEKWEGMSFKYNLVEFCTSLKPFSFHYLMKKGYEKVIYCDPDIFFFSNFDFIYDDLNQYQAILTPHEIHPQHIPSHICRDFEALRSGVFNLGFAAFRATKETLEVMQWWGKRLEDYAVSEVYDGLFTDQKWMDFLPSLLPEGALKVSKNPGMNCAPWNYHEREVISTPEGFHIQSKFEGLEANPLVFFHCAGYDYKKLLSDNPQSAYMNTELTEGIRSLLDACSERLKESDYENYLSWTYSYAQYENGDPITYFQRRMYRRLNNEGFKYQNLFSTRGLFYRTMKNNHLIAIKSLVPEKIKPADISGFETKMAFLDFFASLLRRFAGPDKYALFCKLMHKYFRYENQVRLLGPTFKNIRIR